MASARTKARRGTMALDGLQAAVNFAKAPAGSGTPGSPSGGAEQIEHAVANHAAKIYAGYSKKGYASYNLGKKNQDRGVWEYDAATNALMLCVFDGHGPVGEKVSQKFKSLMPTYVFAQLKAGKSAAEALKFGLKRTEEDLFEDTRVDKTFSGTTAVTSLIIGNKLTVANVGDSRIILARAEGDKEIAEEVSIDHKPERPDEKARILAHGGRVFAEIFEDDDMDAPARVWLGDMDVPGLAMSRSMGDAIAKQAGVISEPEIFERTIEPHHLYFIMGSDGLWEFIENQECVDLVKPLQTPAKAVDFLVAESNRRWEIEDEDSIDDTTVIVVFFKKALEKWGLKDPSAGLSGTDSAAASTESGAGLGAGAGSKPSTNAAPATGAADLDMVSLQFGDEESEGEVVTAEWKRYRTDDTRKVYYYNTTTKATIWEDPMVPGLEGAQKLAAKLKAAKKRAAASGGDKSPETSWEEHVDPASKRTYWFNMVTGASTWVEPEALSKKSKKKKSTKVDSTTAAAGTANGSGITGDAAAEAEHLWEVHVDPATKKRYYFNKHRRKSLWAKPTYDGAKVVGEEAAGVPGLAEEDVVVDKEGGTWEKHVDKKSGRTFYYNRDKRVSSWTHPNASGAKKSTDKPEAAAAGAKAAASAPST